MKKDLKEKKKTIILISHRTRLMRDIGDKLWLLENGKLDFSGVINDPETLNYAIEKKLIDVH